MASSDLNSLMNKTASSKGFVPRSSDDVPVLILERVGSETPITRARIFAERPSLSAARKTAFPTTAASDGILVDANASIVMLLSFGTLAQHSFI